MRAALAIMGAMSGQGPVIYWVALHRLHHEHSDEALDPHSPRFGSKVRGFWHAHIGWMFRHDIPNTAFYAKDLLKDALLARVNRLYPLWFAMGFLLPTTIGGLMTHTLWGAFEGLLWGGFVRLFFLQHVIWSINSVCHVFGARPHPTRDWSRNNAWLAIPSFGESWHNNHHHAPSCAVHGTEPWQIDVAGSAIRLLSLLGLARRVNLPGPTERKIT